MLLAAFSSPVFLPALRCAVGAFACGALLFASSSSANDDRGALEHATARVARVCAFGAVALMCAALAIIPLAFIQLNTNVLPLLRKQIDAMRTSSSSPLLTTKTPSAFSSIGYMSLSRYHRSGKGVAPNATVARARLAALARASLPVPTPLDEPTLALVRASLLENAAARFATCSDVLVDGDARDTLDASSWSNDKILTYIY